MTAGVAIKPRRRKLTDDGVREIRVSEDPTWKIACQFKISESCVHAIRTRRRKAHVPDADPDGMDG